jgi:hypothetical protein
VDGARSIGPQWIKANVIGGIINIAVTFIAFLVGRMLGVNEPETAIVLQAGFVVVATAALTFGLLAMGYLSGVVLRTKLPAFPMRNWLALYAVMGVIFGLISAFAWLTPDVPQDPSSVDANVAISLAVGAVVGGVAISTVVGALQALVLRPAAEGLGLWIWCCSAVGVLFALIVPAVLYGPQSAFASELVIELVTLVVTILAAIVLLPAVQRLTPRGHPAHHPRAIS